MRNLASKADNTAPATTGRLSAAEFNSMQDELETAVTSQGISLDSPSTDVDLTMLAQAMSRSASLGVFATDGGSANTYVLSITGSAVAPKALFTGMRVLFFAAATNTSASTINAFGLGAKAFYTHAGAAMTGGEVLIGKLIEATYDTTLNSSAGAWRIAPWATYIGSTLAGIVLSASLTNPSTSAVGSTSTFMANYASSTNGFGGGGIIDATAGTITVPYTGTYFVHAAGRNLSGGVANEHILSVYCNGSFAADMTHATYSGGATDTSIAEENVNAVRRFTAGDVLRLSYYHDGSTQTMWTGTNFAITRIGY